MFSVNHGLTARIEHRLFWHSSLEINNNSVASEERPQCKNTYPLCDCASGQSDQSPPCPHDETLNSWLFKMCFANILICWLIWIFAGWRCPKERFLTLRLKCVFWAHAGSEVPSLFLIRTCAFRLKTHLILLTLVKHSLTSIWSLSECVWLHVVICTVYMSLRPLFSRQDS